MNQVEIEGWHKNIILLLNSVFSYRNPQLIGFTLRFAVRYFFLRGKPQIVIQLERQAMLYHILKTKYWDLIEKDLKRYITALYN
jgi:hypothetical protein